jgi:hypothetical protein
VLFDREPETTAWSLAKRLKRLSPERVRQLDKLADCMLEYDAIEAELNSEGGASSW